MKILSFAYTLCLTLLVCIGSTNCCDCFKALVCCWRKKQTHTEVLLPQLAMRSEECASAVPAALLPDAAPAHGQIALALDETENDDSVDARVRDADIERFVEAQLLMHPGQPLPDWPSLYHKIPTKLVPVLPPMAARRPKDGLESPKHFTFEFNHIRFGVPPRVRTR